MERMKKENNTSNPRLWNGKPSPGPMGNEPETCETCKNRTSWTPSHNGSTKCRMGASLASGGTIAHCTCAACF